MAHNEAVTVQAVAQGECTDCDRSNDNYSVEERDYSDEGITRTLSCDCGVEAAVTITEDGLESEGPISHEDASWNQD